MAKTNEIKEDSNSFDSLSMTELVDPTEYSGETDSKPVVEATDVDNESADTIAAFQAREQEAKSKEEVTEAAKENTPAEEEIEVIAEKKEEKIVVDKKDNKEEVKVDNKDNKTEDEFKIVSFDDIDEIPIESKSIEGEPNGWKEVAAELKLEIKDDSFESLQEAINEKSEYNLAKFKPETQRLIKATEAGMTIDDFTEPFAKIDAALMLSDSELVDRHLQSEGWLDNDKREAKLASMDETGELEVIANQARKSLVEYKKEEKDKIINERIKAQEKFELRAKNAPLEEAKAIEAVLKKHKEFLGSPISDKNIEKIVNKYKSGEYNETFKDDETIAEFLLYKEYGKVALSNYKAKFAEDFKKENKAVFHNTPIKTGAAGSVTSTPSGHDPMGNWDLLEKERVG